MIRDLILTVTILCIVYIAAHQPPPVKTVQVDYCVIEYKAAAKDRFGIWHEGWARGYGMCRYLDRYENI